MTNHFRPRLVSNAAKLWIILFLILTSPLPAHAESIVQGKVINAPAKLEDSSNIAEGSENSAAQSSVSLKNSRMSGTLVNSTQSKTAVNLATGKRNVASQGSVAVSQGTVEGSVVNSVAVKSTANLAAGTDNKADQGAVRIDNSRIRGAVTNTVTLQKSANMAAGKGNSASQAAIVVGGGQVGGALANTATGDNAVNAAAGYRSEASQASIVVDGGQPGSGSAATMPQNVWHADTGGMGQEEGRTPASAGKKMVMDAKDRKAAHYVPGQVVFLIDNNKAGLANLDRAAKKHGLTVTEKNVLKSLNRIMVVSSTAKDAAAVAEALKSESGVYNAQPNYVFATMAGQDPMSSMQNLVSMLDLPEVHNTVSGKHITVAVVDTGVEVEHEDLRARVVGHQNFISGSGYQGEIHGTAVAGIIGAGKNDCGIVGIAPDVSLLALRACRQVSKTSSAGECFSTSLMRSLDAAISAKVHVVNLSLGAYVNDSLLSMMIDSGHDKGIVFAAPVGNDPAAENIAFPASHSKVVSVAGFDELGNPLPNKKLAAKADAVAPATHLFVTAPGNSYNFVDGTSLASASITGIIALSMEKNLARNPPCLPRFTNALPWSKQVFVCLGL
ncbi:MAG: S8 family serine peptidase [Desulforhopalus sp.]|nr:S8 family serine peptidase [Desulforhopalus sp.]